MDLNGNIIDIYDLTPIDDYGKMIEAKFITDSTLMASAVWGDSTTPKAVILDTLGNILHQANLLDNEWMARTEVTFDKKLLFLTNIHDDTDNFDTYLFKLNQKLETDTIYNQWFNYDSLCAYQIVSDTIVQDGCGIIVGMEEIYEEDSNKEKELLVYPNPARNKFTLQCKVFVDVPVRVELFDLFGQKVQTINVRKGQEEVDVRVVGLQRGLYLIRVSSENGFVGSEKVMVR